MTAKQFFSGLMIVLGALTMALSGGCSFIALVAFGREYGMFPIIMAVGGVPFLIGWALFAGGKHLKKK